jgi:hypothetical protein
VIGTDAGSLVHQMRIAALKQDVGLGPYNEESCTQREPVKTPEIDVAAVHDVERAGFGIDLVKDVDVMHLAVGNANKCREIAVQVQQRVHFDGTLLLAELGPWEQ